VPSMKPCVECGNPRRVSKTSANNVTCRDCRDRRRMLDGRPALVAIRPDDPRPPGDLLRSLDASLAKAPWVRESDPPTVELARTIARQMDDALARWDTLHADLVDVVDAAVQKLDTVDGRTLMKLARQLAAADHPLHVMTSLSGRYRDVLAELGLSPSARKRVDTSPQLPFAGGVHELRRRAQQRRTIGVASSDVDRGDA